MWTYNSTYNKWSSTDDKLTKSDFDYLKQELKATRFYAKSLSGATYLPINGTDDVYDILSEQKRLEKLKGNLEDYYSIRINNQWRIIFQWLNNDAYDVKIIDYH